MPHAAKKAEWRVEAILELADRLGHFPTYREVVKHLKWGMRAFRVNREEALARYEGRMAPSATKEPPKLPPVIVGVTADESINHASDLLERAYRMQDRHAEMMRRKRSQRIEFPPEPIGVAFLSDVHFGAPGTDYRTAFSDAELIKETPGLYAVFHGDGVDNFVIGRLARINMSREFTIDDEWKLLRAWIDMIGEKWLAVVSGNHDAWTRVTAGIDYLRTLVGRWGPLYDSDDASFTLQVGSQEWVVRVRHQWRGNSVFNPTHGIEVGWARAGMDFDVGVGGHTHRGTLIRPFVKHGKERYAVLTGAYKLEDAYGRERGFDAVHSTGAAAILFRPDGVVLPVPDLTTAAATLEAWRSSWGARS